VTSHPVQDADEQMAQEGWPDVAASLSGGGMRERTNRTVSKTVVSQGTVGSNPTPSATVMSEDTGNRCLKTQKTTRDYRSQLWLVVLMLCPWSGDLAAIRRSRGCGRRPDQAQGRSGVCIFGDDGSGGSVRAKQGDGSMLANS
jgi:hypothetical protein